jgi:hypothetical protein
MKRFCVDNNSDPQAAEGALRDLKRMVKFGRRAEKILKALKEEGRFDGQIPMISKSDGGYSVGVHRFPAYESISRADIPGWENLSLEFGDQTEGSYGGSKFLTMPIYLKGTALMMELDADCGYTGRVIQARWFGAKIARARLGDCRLKSNGTVTFEANDRYLNTKVFKIRRSGNAEEAETFAKLVAKCLINLSASGYSMYQQRHKVSQKMIDLQNAVPGWLLEDGHIDRFFDDTLNAILVTRVMDL